MAISAQTAVLLMLVWLCEVSVTYGNVPVVTGVHLSTENQMRHITLQYEAQDKPVILWRTMSFITHLDNTTNSFSPRGHGEATLHMYVNPRDQVYERNWTIRALIYANSYQISLDIKKGDIRYSQSVSNTLHPIILSAQPAGTIVFHAGEIVNIDLSVEAHDLGSYEIANSWGDLTGFDYEAEPPATVLRKRILSIEEIYGYNDECPAFIMPHLNITGPGSTVASTPVVINTSCPYTEGEIEFGVRLIFGSEHSLLHQITLRRWVYLKDMSQIGPFRGKVNFIRDDQNRKRRDTMTDRTLYTQVDAMGDPKPDIKLFRDCRELTEPEVEIYSIGTPYRTRKIIRFMNATDSLTGAYYVSVTSGDNEITKMNYITKL